LKIAPLAETTDPTTQEGIVCNYLSHWFSIRKVNGHWFNLNSLFKEGPQLISTFYLSAYLKQLQTEKWSIFVVTGTFPTSAQALGGRGEWFPVSTIVGRSKRSSSVMQQQQSPEGKTRSGGGIVDRAMRAISNFTGGEEDPELARVIEISRRDAERRSPPPSRRPAPPPSPAARDYDAQLAMALALSQREK